MYKSNEVLTAATEYFNGDNLAAEVWLKKYALQDMAGNYYELTPNDMHRRLAKEFARIEAKYKNPLSEDEIFDLIKEFKYIVPAGSPMAGIGNNYQIMSLSNCYVIGNEVDSDSYGGILKLDQEQVQLMKRRAGVGLDLSFIRPEGSQVLNSALTSTGVVPFMERFSNSTREVAQGGRRGASIQTISIKHPDAEKFIDAKMIDGKVTGANISVKLTDEFMNAALNNHKFVQQYPIDSDKPTYKKEINAKELWDKIIHNAWQSAEPGLLFWDTIIRESVPDCYQNNGFKTVSVNPCQPKWAKILTKKGVINFGDANIGDEIWSSEGWTKIVNKWSNGVKKVYKYQTTSNVFYGTENHRVLDNGDKIEASKATNIDLLKGPQQNKTTLLPQVIMDGLVLGDGMVHRASNDLVLLFIGDNDFDYFNSEIKDLIRKNRDGVSPKAYEIFTNIESDILVKTYNRRVPSKYISSGAAIVCSFLRGLYSANGSVVKGRVTLKSTSFGLIEDVQLMLNSIGIGSYFTTNKPKVVKFLNGDYECKKSYDLNINSDSDKFLELIGFIQKYKVDKLSSFLLAKKYKLQNKKAKKIIETTFISEEEVFDITVDNNSHTYWSQGCNISNCAELTLSSGDSCRLISINLYNYVENPFTKKAQFNFALFKEHVSKAQRMMDDLIDLELEKIDIILNKIENDPEPDNIKQIEKDLWVNIREKARLGRRCGLGITAEGDMLAALGLTYGTDEAIKFAEKIQRTLKLEAYRCSTQLSKERGPFEIWNPELEKNNPFLLRIKEEDKELYDEMNKYGRRNIGLLTIAPTGSVSTLTRTTSGIEPVFLPVYTRRRKINPQEKDVRVDFIDKQGDSWQEYPVFHHKFEIWLQINGYNVDNVKKLTVDDIQKIVEKSPYYKATSVDVDWVKNVEMQGRLQRNVDHSISKTVNLPNNATEELVAQVYETAWRVGCKGITVYRDGSRSGVLISNKENKKEKTFESHAAKRPKIINADVWVFQNNYEKWVAVVGKNAPFEGADEIPYELFTGKLDSFLIPTYVEHGQIIKRKIKNEAGEEMSMYDFKYIDKDGYPVEMAGLSRSFNEEYWNYAKLISAILRHGMPMLYIVNVIGGLKLNGDTLSTWKNGVIRTLKKYIKDGTVSQDKCEVCGAKLVYSEGCLKCVSCGQYSKCG